MDPEQWLALQTYFMNGGNSPALYNTGEAPNPDAPELDPYAQYVYATGAAPNTNKSGELLPYNLDYQKSLTNYQQDTNQVLADPVNAYMASLMGGEGFAPGVFDPVNKETQINLTQLPVLQQMAQAGGYQGTIAKLIMPKAMGGQGMNPATAAALLQRVMNNPEAGAQVGIDPSLLEQIKGELPPVINSQGYAGPEVVPGQYDWKQVAQDAQQMWQPMAAEMAQINAPGVVNRDGRFFSTEQTDSPQTEFLKKLGIPNPNARYDLQYALQNDPTIAGLFGHAAQTSDQAALMRKTFEQYTKKIAKQRDAAIKAREDDARRTSAYQQGPLREWADKMDVQAGGIKQSMADYFSQAARGGSQFQAQPLGPGGEMATLENRGPSPLGPQRYQAAPAGPDLPDFSWPGAQPTPPQLSAYSTGGGRTADEVAQLFNKASSFLPGAFRPEQQAVEAGRKPLQMMANAANKASVQDQVALFKSMLPNMARNASGRTPAKDVIQQRLLPLYASGAFGQQGLPTAYPNRAAVIAAFGG